MNKYQLYTLGGALLAATSLSAAAQASSVGTVAGAQTFSTTPLKLAATTLSGTAATANGQIIGNANLPRAPAILFSNFYDHGFNLYIAISISGTSNPLFDITSSPSVDFLIRDAASATITATVSAAGLNGAGTAASISQLGTNIYVDNVNITSAGSLLGTGGTGGSASIAGVILQGVHFTNLAGLASAGGSISIGASVYTHANQTTPIETVAPGVVVTSVAPLTTTVAPATAASVAVGTGTVQFTALSGASAQTLTLATISITGTGALATDLSTAVSADGANSTASASNNLLISVTSTAISDSSASAIAFEGGNNVAVQTYETIANFTSGTATFTLAPATTTYSGTSAIVLTYNGTSAISAAAAGTATVSFSAGGSSAVAPASASGATTVVSRSGLNTQVNWANSGSTGFTSFVRIHNTGNVAAPAQIVVKQDTTDGSAITTLGTFTTPTSIPAGGTVQVSVPTIEAGLGITANPAHSYTLLITGAFPGYVQHLSYNGTALIDLDGFRSGGGVTP